MQKIFEKIENIFNSKYGNLYGYGIIFILCFLIMAGQNFRLEIGNDDLYYTKVVQKFGSAYNAMIDQYKNWNSRYFTSFVMAYVMDKNIWLWRILNTSVLFAFFIFSAKIIKVIYNLDIKKYTVTAFLIFASFALLSTGIWTSSITWVTGSFNYLWPASSLAISFYYLFNSSFNKEKLKLYQFIILIPVVMFASNTEQSALICVAMYSIVIFYFILKERYFDKYIILLYVIIIISTLVVFLSPALPIRYTAEVKNWYPIFNEMSILTKALHGYSYTILVSFLLFDYPNTILLSILLFIILRKQYNNMIFNIISLFPAFYSLIYYIGRVNTEWRDSSYIYNLSRFSSRYLSNNLDEPFFSVIIGTLILFIIIFCVLKLQWSSFERKYLAILFFGAALTSAFMISFSPTIYASGERVFFIPYSMYMFGICMVFVEVLKHINMKTSKFIVITSLYFIVALIDVFGKSYR